MAEPDIDLALKVIQRALKEKGRSQAWLGAEVARLEGRENPYTQASVSAWLVKIGEQLAGRIFSIEDAMHKVDVTAFIEALGQDFATREKPGPFRATLEAAKRIHKKHHRRG